MGKKHCQQKYSKKCKGVKPTKYNSDHLNPNVKRRDSGGVQEGVPSFGKPVHEATGI